MFCNSNCTEDGQGWCWPCKMWGSQALLRAQQQPQGFLLSAVRRCPATPGVTEKMLIYDRSTHHSFLLSSHCFPAVPSDCAGTGTLGKSRDGTRQGEGLGFSGSLFTNPGLFCILLYSGQGAQPVIGTKISITNGSHFCCAWNRTCPQG